MRNMQTIGLVALLSLAGVGCGTAQRVDKNIKTPCRFNVDVEMVGSDAQANVKCRRGRGRLTDDLQLITPEVVSRGCFNARKDGTGWIVAQTKNIYEEIRHAVEVFCTEYELK